MRAAPGEPAPGAAFTSTGLADAGFASAGSADVGFANVGFDWDGAMHAGLGLLRLAPRDFWAMTPRELAAALGMFLPRHAAAPDRADLSELMRRFPERVTVPTPAHG